jgi:hypothetical protein
MIIQRFDNGWGLQFPLKKFEAHIVERMLAHISADSSRTVVVNSVWYTGEYHQQVLAWLRDNPVDRIVLIAMLDAAIPAADWYKEFDCEILTVGYYAGPHAVDFCAVFVDEFLKPPPLDILMSPVQIDTAYMCLNRKPHWHRQKLYRRLETSNLLDRGIVSMGGTGLAVRSLPTDCEPDDLAPNAAATHYGIPNDIVSLGHMQNWQRHLVNVVTETFFDINQTGFVSEKIYKPIVGCRPFLVYDPDGGTKWLADRGFETYVADFADITDLDLAEPAAMHQFLGVLCDQQPKYWQAKFLALSEKILYNKNHFTDYVHSQKQKIQKGIPCQI